MKSKEIYLTYCSKKKDESPELLPAIKRYKGSHIQKVYDLAVKNKVEFRILSGSPFYHLLSPDDRVKLYDHLLQPHEVEGKVQNVVAQLTGHNLHQIVFFLEDPNEKNIQPYKDVMKKVCWNLGIAFDVEII